jgi:ParB family transcriptional regulator, chromosome partitioning protein
MRLPIDTIIIDEDRRIRKDPGDIDRLEASIRSIGLLSPVVVTADHHLVAGFRRLTACKRMGWKEIDVTVIAYGTDPLRLLEAEADENLARKDFTPDEVAAIEVRRQEIIASLNVRWWVRLKRWLVALWSRMLAGLGLRRGPTRLTEAEGA